MRAPSLLAQCLPGLLPQDRGGVSALSEKDLQLPPPAVEIIPSKTAAHHRYSGENLDVLGLQVFKGKVSVADIMGLSGSETALKNEGSLKSWESSIVLVNVLKNEIRDGQLSFRGKRVLELGCNYGVPGIFACLKGASSVHFQDLNAETIRCTTIPNVLANLEQARDRQSRQPESPLTPSRQAISASVRFYAGEWEELSTVLSIIRTDVFEPAIPTMNLSFSEEDFMDGCSSQDGSITGQQDFSSRRSRKLSGSRAWERANETDQGGECGYDVILMTEIPYSVTSLKKLYSLIKKCLRPPYGVMYLAAKKQYVGFNSGAKHLRNLVDEETILGAHLVKETTDRDIWKFFLK
ncbi:S-adenosyl-L-methionine-dependent methyltransferase [Arabidopsis thaliana x Arabidopsis arenosa]|uniref:S-adenosyl-L-methionine-dependent methyltransferase n=1 Tax=Arabidopsis thaliana x Arabidopsis arenosa TaxID=1240361 RepID=A0A8T2AC01_9BRAS|nr:S-adenosyl-L-methionine-dependent methyltransferase [Arabidopsis thaliana x Arabidopsis arenosa]KAG7570300.1 S-adenosyl-L-methionine-dependent methyltransferase [Arabidopsis thaliana x Arabidopsis arenosa]